VELTLRPFARPRLLPWLALLLVVSAFAAAGIGAVELSTGEMVGFLLAPDRADPTRAAIFWDLRLPRVALAMLVGALLAVSGGGLQALFRNPLADPAIVGVSTGAAFGAVAGIVLLTSTPLAVPGAAFAGAIVATASVLRLGRSSESLLLAGIAVSALAMAFMGLFIYVADDAQLRSISFWNLGSLGAASWTVVAAVALPAAICAALWMRLATPLNLLLLGDAEARHAGVPVERVRRLVIVAVALGVAGSVAWTGIISFVGLLVPHLVRAVTGPDHRRLLPACALAGASLLLVADTVSRTLVAPAELPIGVLTALAGAPCLLFLVLGRRG
jgi:iron complex transport system permease protein